MNVCATSPRVSPILMGFELNITIYQMSEYTPGVFLRRQVDRGEGRERGGGGSAGFYLNVLYLIFVKAPSSVASQPRCDVTISEWPKLSRR